MSFQSLSFDELCERICERKNTLIVFHTKPDADAIGSAFALRALLFEMGIPAICACDDEVPERLEFICEAVQGGVIMNDVCLGHERVISVDAASGAQLGNMFERLLRDIDIMIDHHATGTLYADNYVRPEAAACAEIIFDVALWLLERGRISRIPPEALDCIYAGISSDTGGFKYANVTPETHRCAARLIEMGVDTARINHLLFDAKSLKQIKAEGEAARRLSLYKRGRIASVVFPYSAKFSLGLREEHLETLIEIPRSLEGVEIAFCVKQNEDKNLFKVSMRSNCDFDVSAICARFGGGGHRGAAGCTIEARGADEAANMILCALEDTEEYR